MTQYTSIETAERQTQLEGWINIAVREQLVGYAKLAAGIIAPIATVAGIMLIGYNVSGQPESGTAIAAGIGLATGLVTGFTPAGQNYLEALADTVDDIGGASSRKSILQFQLEKLEEQR